MAERKAPKAPAKKAGATKKTVAKKAGATKKTVAKKAGATKKTAAKKAGATKKTAAKKAGATKKTVAKKAGATKKTVAKKAGAKRAAPKKNPAAGAVRNIMYTCRSCVWTEAQREIDGKRQGTFLLEAINELADKNPLPASIDMRGVFCLNGCLNPCNVSFRARDKYSLRFSRLTPDHAADIVAVAEAYAASGDGNLSDEEIPAELRDKVSVRTPPPPSSRP